MVWPYFSKGALAACLVNLPKDAAEALAGEAQ